MFPSQQILSARWTLLGRWRQPLFLASTVMGAVGNPSFGSAIPARLSTYLSVDHGQYAPEQEFKENCESTLRLLSSSLIPTYAQLKLDIAQHSRALDSLSPQSLDEPLIRELSECISFQGRQWYELTLADPALSSLYSASLPKNFSFLGERWTPEKLLACAAVPTKLLPMVEEHEHLLSLAKSMKDGEPVEERLAEHVERFSWMNSLCWWDEPFTLAHYQKEAAKLAQGNPGEELEKIHSARSERTGRAQTLLEALKEEHPLAWQIISVIRELTDCKEENWDAVSLAGARFRPAFRESAASLGISFEQFMQLTPAEMRQSLSSGTLAVAAAELSQRLSSRALFLHEGTLSILCGNEVQSLHERIRAPVEEASLQGTPVWMGVVRGKVRVLTDSTKIHELQPGEILVCPMSDPDYLPAIRKAAAIITDQGGLLCHAAIVARELEIPCIVGTRFATRLLKTGDWIEVNAGEGTVNRVDKEM